MTDIYFYSSNVEYGWMSNFWRATQVVDEISYITNEHYYQSQKAIGIEAKAWIASQSTPYKSMQAGRSLRAFEMVPNWDLVFKFDVMLRGLRAKFSQNEDLKKLLLETGDVVLHEDSPTDMVWGVKGEDRLGKLLMQVRSELRP
jgi:ribA/ribD-fused uncharacterized protein